MKLIFRSLFPQNVRARRDLEAMKSGRLINSEQAESQEDSLEQQKQNGDRGSLSPSSPLPFKNTSLSSATWTVGGRDQSLTAREGMADLSGTHSTF